MFYTKGIAPIKDLREYGAQSIYMSCGDLGIFNAFNKATEEFFAEAEPNPDAVPLNKVDLNPLFKEYRYRGLDLGDVYIPSIPSSVTFIADRDTSKAADDHEPEKGFHITIGFKPDTAPKE